MIKETDIIELSKYSIKGGIHPQEFKLLSNRSPIKELPLSKKLILPFQSDNELVGAKKIILGDSVQYGQELLATRPSSLVPRSLSPCNAEVSEFGFSQFGHLSTIPEPSITLLSKDDDRPTVFTPITDWKNTKPEVLLERVKQAGIVGLGGAVFPTAIKLMKHKKTFSDSPIETLIINAMECEPYITCDDCLTKEYADEILQGALMTAHITGASNILFGFEDNKVEAITILADSIKNLVQEYEDLSTPLVSIKITVTPTKYPSGGEKQLIELLTGKQVPQKQYPASIGLVVQNIATIFSIYQAVYLGTPLTHRLVTITGDCVEQPANYWIAFGTPINHIITSLSIDKTNLKKITLGGPMMGPQTTDFNIPTSAAVNCIIFNRESKVIAQSNDVAFQSHQPCIRCSECETACPASLLPQQLYWFSQSEQWLEAERYSLFDCIECGACSFVCPSEIPLVEYYRFAKLQIKQANIKQQKSDIAKLRFENRERRFARIKLERDEKRKKTAAARKQAAEDKKSDPEGKKSAIEAALARVKKKEDNANP